MNFVTVVELQQPGDNVLITIAIISSDPIPATGIEANMRIARLRFIVFLNVLDRQVTVSPLTFEYVEEYQLTIQYMAALYASVQLKACFHHRRKMSHCVSFLVRHA